MAAIGVVFVWRGMTRTGTWDGTLAIAVRLTKCTNAPIQYCSDDQMGWPSGNIG